MNVIDKTKSYIKFPSKSPIKTAYKIGSIIVVQWEDGSFHYYNRVRSSEFVNAITRVKLTKYKNEALSKVYSKIRSGKVWNG